MPLQSSCKDHCNFVDYFKNIWRSQLFVGNILVLWFITMNSIQTSKKIDSLGYFSWQFKGWNNGCYHGFYFWFVLSYFSSAHCLPVILYNLSIPCSKITFVSLSLTLSLNTESQGIIGNSKFPGTILIGQLESNWVTGSLLRISSPKRYNIF